MRSKLVLSRAQKRQGPQQAEGLGDIQAADSCVTQGRSWCLEEGGEECDKQMSDFTAEQGDIPCVPNLICSFSIGVAT